MKMNLKKCLQIIIVVFIFFTIIGTVTVNAATTPVFMISTNPGEDSNREMRINWHTAVETTGTYVLYTTKDDVEWMYAKKVDGNSEINHAFNPAYNLNAIGESVRQCGAVLTGLKEGTEYMYTVGNDLYRSEPYYFKTGGQEYSFIWTSDFHAYSASAARLKAASKNIEEAIVINNGVDFVLSTGDTIAHGGTYEWWEQLSNAAWMKRYMYADTLGNHDWMTSKGTETTHGASHIFFGATHNNPKNGYIANGNDQNNICFYFYYGDTLFISLNTEEYSQAQYDWCEEVLKNNDAQYKIIFQHYQMFNDYGDASSTGYTRWWKLCDKYDVDVAFAGNSHVYMRSKSLYNNQVSDDMSKGTVYITAPSSDGDRGKVFPGIKDANKDRMAFGWAGGLTQVACSIVNVTVDGIRVRLVNNGGAILDDAFINAKRGPSLRYNKDISDFDKDEFESNVRYIQSQIAPTKGYLAFPTTGILVLSKVEIIKDNTVYYTHDLKEFPVSMFAINDYDTSEYDIRLHYVDGSIKNMKIPKVNNYSFREITNLRIGINDQKFVLTWEGDSQNAKELQVFKNNQYLKTISSSLNSCEVDFEGEFSTFYIKVIDANGNVLKTTNQAKYINYGDVNLDGQVNEQDVIDIQKSILGQYTILNVAKPLANVFEPGVDVINIADANYLHLYLSGQIQSLSKTTYTVTFKDTNGKVLNTSTVNIGENATYSSNAQTLIGFDKDITNIQSDLDVTVYFELLPEIINLHGNNEVPLIGDTAQLSWSVNAPNSLNDVVFSSSDETIATIDENGLVTFIAHGEVTITAKSLYSETSATHIIKCLPLEQKQINADLIVYHDKNATSIVLGKAEYSFTAPVHTTIASALAAATEGQTIVVLPGTYSDNLVITKSVHLVTLNEDIAIGANRLGEAIITGKVAIKASNVVINGFKFTYSTSQPGTSATGMIYTSGGTNLSDITISYNDITCLGIGSHTGIIRIGNSDSGTTLTNLSITNNKIHSNGTNSGISNRTRGSDQASEESRHTTKLVNALISDNVLTCASSYFGGMNLELGTGGSMTISNNSIASGTDHIIRFTSGTGTVTLIGHTSSDVKYVADNIVLDIK